MFRPSAPRTVNWLFGIMFDVLWQMAIRPTATQVPYHSWGSLQSFDISVLKEISHFFHRHYCTVFFDSSGSSKMWSYQDSLYVLLLYGLQSLSHISLLFRCLMLRSEHLINQKIPAKFSTTPSFILSNASFLLIICFVLSRRGTWIVM